MVGGAGDPRRHQQISLIGGVAGFLEGQRSGGGRVDDRGLLGEGDACLGELGRMEARRPSRAWTTPPPDLQEFKWSKGSRNASRQKARNQFETCAFPLHIVPLVTRILLEEVKVRTMVEI